MVDINIRDIVRVADPEFNEWVGRQGVVIDISEPFACVVFPFGEKPFMGNNLLGGIKSNRGLFIDITHLDKITIGEDNMSEKKVVKVLAVNDEYKLALIEWEDRPFVVNLSDLSRFKIACSVCGELHDFDDLGATEHNGYICETCRASFVQCPDCGKWVPESEMKDVGGHHICAKCATQYKQCSACGEWHKKSDMRVVDGQWYCQSCLHAAVEEGEILQCSNCGDYHHADQMETDEESGEVWCHPCFGERYTDYIHGYHGSRDPRFISLGSNRGNPLSKNIYIGVEHEVPNVGRNGYLAKKLTDMFSRKVETDSSVHDGMEIISDAMTFKYWKQTQDLDKYMDILNKEGLSPDDSSGIHVHISNAPLGKDAVAEIGVFVMTHYADCLKFGRRNPDRCGYCEQHSVDGLSTNGILDRLARHCSAVNLSNSSNLELRFFKTTNEASHMWAIIEFAHALSLTAKSGKSNFGWDDIREVAVEDGNCEHFIAELDADFESPQVNGYDYTQVG